MEIPEGRGMPKAHGPVAVSTAHALLVAPAVGGVVLTFVAVGIAALALGAMVGFARHRDHARHLRREQR